MTITIRLPPETERKLLVRAAATGKDVNTFVQEAIEEKLRASPPTFDEICAPLREAVEATGMTDEELDTLFQKAIAEVRQERRQRQDKA
ncbi:MAG: type II toxin-antitoxin system HicB family antitoxin [Gemmataceae bacterium]|nr:type II toxin-antitoxin system HicB family antitoxin [Gemmataceae bacterium]